MPKKPVILNDEYQFASKKEAIEFYSNILNACELNVPLSGHDYIAVEALLLNHPRSDDKIGCGIKELFVGSDAYGGRCFHIRRTDETIENFGIGKCINGDLSDFAKFRQAARRAVESEIFAFKARYFSENSNANGQVKCPETKEWISFEDAHVDHRVPMTFSMIVRGYLAAKKMFDKDFDLTCVSYDHDGTYGASFVDNSLATEFAEYHRQQAVLRVIKSKQNLSKAYLGRVKTTKADRTLV